MQSKNQKLSQNSKSFLSGITISNWSLKDMLIKEFENNICFFFYPRDRKKSEMIFSYKIQSSDVTETWRNTDNVKDFATLFRKECEDFEFLLQRSFNSLKDLVLSSAHHSYNQPSSWNSYIDTMPSIRNKSASITKICDTIFHIVYYLIHNGQKKTPLHVSLCECVYDTCRSKALIQIKNRLLLCISYDEMER